MQKSKINMESKPYEKTLDDELDWSELDQLHDVVSQISNFCFETKKFCITTELLALALLAKFTDNKVDSSLFIAALIIPLCFWLLDSVAYYYQRKLRDKMELICHRLKERNGQKTSPNKENKSPKIRERGYCKVAKSAFNHSMWIYVFMILINISVWAFF